MKQTILQQHWDQSVFTYKYIRFDDLINHSEIYKTDTDNKPYHELMQELKTSYQTALNKAEFSMPEKYRHLEISSLAKEICKAWGDTNAEQISQLYLQRNSLQS